MASILFPSQLEHLSIRPRLENNYYKTDQQLPIHLLLDLANPLVDFDFFFTGLVMILGVFPAFAGEDITKSEMRILNCVQGLG